MTVLFSSSIIAGLSVNYLFNSPVSSLFISGILAFASLINLIDSNNELNKMKRQKENQKGLK